MKTIVVLLFLLCASAAFAQSGALSAEPIIIQMPSHARHASYMPLGQEQNLAEHSTYTIAQGERPLWEVAQEHYETPLGDVARTLREEHLKARKAEFVREN